MRGEGHGVRGDAELRNAGRTGERGAEGGHASDDLP